MDEEVLLSEKSQCLDTKSLTIKIDPIFNSTSSSPFYSPSLISPPSSAFVSALQSPYISPRATLNPSPDLTLSLDPQSPPPSYSGSQSEDIPSSSYTPPPERSDFSESKVKIVTCVPISGPDSAPRISFSFPVPRISFAKGSASPASNAKLRSCDVFIGFNGQNPNLIRFCKWFKSELELQGIACFVADRAKYSDTQSHEIVDRVICSVTFGVIIITNNALSNHHSLEEIRFFAQKRNLIPLFFDIGISEVTNFGENSDSKECKEAVDGILRYNEFKLETIEGNWRGCVSKAVGILRGKLGRNSVTDNDIEGFEELPFPRNRFFLGREREMAEMEAAFFGYNDNLEQEILIPTIKGGTPGQSEGLADEESGVDTSKEEGGFINLELGKCKEPKLEAWVEPIIGRNSLKRSKYKKSKSGKYKGYNSGVMCINGGAGIGKTEVALEFAYRYAHRYKMVLWVGGEARYFRQNILNLSLNLGLDMSADEERERGRIRTFEEQETEAFKRVKRELFREIPYLLIIDNLESEKEWWEGKDLHDLIPRNTGGTHVIITTRLLRVMNFDPMNLQPLPLSDAMILVKGRRKKDYSSEEIEYFGKFDEELGRSSFGLWIIGCLLSEFQISPSTLFHSINQIQVDESSTRSNLLTTEKQFFRNNPFLIKVLSFCVAILQQTSEKRKNTLALNMLLVGAWFAPSPISANLIAAAAKSIPAKRKSNWTTKGLKSLSLCCFSGCYLTNQTWKSEEESAQLLIKLGLVKKANRNPGFHIQFHPITQMFSKIKEGPNSTLAKAMVQGVRKNGNPLINSDHLWASAFLVFGFKSEPPLVQLKPFEMVLFIRKTALPLAIQAFTKFSRCNSSLELLKVCTNILEEVEKSFVSQIQNWSHYSLCWLKTKQGRERVDEYVWQEVTLLKASLLETRAKLLLRGGCFDSGEEVCRTCISIRTVMLGHNHALTLAAQETLAKLVRMRSKM